jgi:probable phosphoglycerate mutase
MIPLLVIRHAATDWNELRLLQGRADRPLSPAGRAWAARARLPEGWDGARCLSSPLRRTMDTAHLLELDPRPEPRLIEMDWGEWEGRSLADLRAELGDALAANERRGLDFRPPGGESPRDVQERLRPFLREVREPTVAITHKGVVRALYALASGWTMQDDPPEKLRAGCAHLFGIGSGGAVSVEALNLPLEAPA